MATLVSPGVDVSITDESAYASPGAGTIPLVVIATAQDKTDPTGTEVDGIARFTKASAAGSVVPVTSQRDLTQFFGDPIFALTEGAETSEYGLLAAYSYLGQGAQAYVVRAAVDLSELVSQDDAPTGPVPAARYWLDTDASSYGVHRWNGTAWILQSVTVEVDLGASAGEVADPSTYVPTTTASAAPDDQTYLVAVLSDGTTGWTLGYFVNENGTWTALNDAWATANSSSVAFAGHYSAPAAPSAGDVWVKTTRPGSGINLVVYRSDTVGNFDLVDVEGVTEQGSSTYVAQNGSSLSDISSTMTNASIALAVGASTTAGVELQDVVAGAATAIADAEIYTQDAAPTGTPVAGQYWYNASQIDLDILTRGAAGWERVAEADIQFSVTAPVLDKSGAALTGSDIWVDTSATEREFPKIHKWNGAEWLLHDNSDQTTDRGVLFDDFVADDRVAIASGDIDANNTAFDSRPAYQLYPAGMIAVNTTASKNTVRVWQENIAVNSGAATVNAWVNGSANNADGSGTFGRLAQRRIVATAMQAAVAANEDLRDPNRNFTLMCAPNYPELVDELVTLNSDRGETAFQIIDTPMRKSPTEAVAWAGGVGAAENGEDGLVTKNTYSAVYYPAGRSTTPSGRTVTVPPSHMALYTFAYNDNIAFPWFAPAGLTRGVVQNGSAVGYITAEEEFKAVSLSQGQRDALQLNKSNPVANFPLEGVVVFGQKTMHPTAGALDRVNVARLVAYLRERFDDIARPLLFEQNDALTRKRAVHIFERFLSDLMTKRALSDFAVVCDTSNNTPIRIDRNELYIDIAIAPIKSVEFIYIPIRIVNTGAL
jgi:phage tail sheath protein FI